MKQIRSALAATGGVATFLACLAGPLTATVAYAADVPVKAATATTAATAPAEQPWKHKVKKLDRADVDALLAKPETLVFVDVRRPDELTSKGGFPVYLSIQSSELEKSLAYVPRDRTIVTVSNHAARAGAAGDLLIAKGFQVAGAIGVETYEAQGGTLTKIAPPAPKAQTAAK